MGTVFLLMVSIFAVLDVKRVNNDTNQQADEYEARNSRCAHDVPLCPNPSLLDCGINYVTPVIEHHHLKMGK